MATYNGHNEDASGNILLSIGNGMTATVETGTKASQAYTKGSYLYYNNRLCKVTAAIASGATLTIGTNIAYTSVGAELTSHLRASDGNEFYFDIVSGVAGYYPTSAKTSSTFVPFGGSGINSFTCVWKDNLSNNVAKSTSITANGLYGFFMVSVPTMTVGTTYTSLTGTNANSGMLGIFNLNDGTITQLLIPSNITFTYSSGIVIKQTQSSSTQPGALVLIE